MSATDVKTLVDEGFTSRVLFGSDIPINLIYNKGTSTSDYLKDRLQELKTTIGNEAFNLVAGRTVYHKS